MVCLQHSSFLPGPDFSISCSTSKSGAQPHRVTSVPQALFLLLLPPGGYAPLPSPTWPRSTKVFIQSWVPGMRSLDSAALIQNQNQGLPAIEKSLLGSKTRLLLKLLPLAWKQWGWGGWCWEQAGWRGNFKETAGEERTGLELCRRHWAGPGLGEKRRRGLLND